MTDDEGGRSNAPVVITAIVLPPNQPPVAVLTAEPTEGRAPETIAFDASGSYDRDGKTVLFEWDWESDGEYDFATAWYTRPEHRYEDPGFYTATLRVTDNRGASDTAEVEFVLVPNLPPHAELVAEPTEGDNPLTVQFDASGSWDPEGDELSYRWKFSGEFDYHDSPFAEHTYYRIGTPQATVWVSDDRGGEAFATVEITLHTGWHIVPVDVGDEEGLSAESWIFGDVGITIAGGHPAVCYIREGYLGYARALDALGMVWGTPQQVDNFGSSELFAPAISIIGGNPALTCHQVFGEVHFTLAGDDQGASWDDTQLVHYFAGTGKSTSLAEVNGHPAVVWLDSLGYLNYSRADDALGTSWPDPIKFEKLDNVLFNGQCELKVITGVPAIAYVHETQQEVRFVYSADEDGSEWVDPITLSQVSPALPMVALAEVGGVPMVCYNSPEGLVVQVAPDGLGFDWSLPTVVDDKEYKSLSISSVNGKPVIAGSGPVYYAARDPLGTEWNPGEIASGGGRLVAITEVDGKPAITFEGNNESIFYAIRLD
ncbi:hypothetical protein IIA79_08260 [bacterium]|nr:hypothetical protein [bacterium]